MAARFPRPTLEAVVFAQRPEDSGRLRAALGQLAEQDPLIDVRQDERHEISVSLYGEVQKEVIQATLEREYGIVADFRETTVLCIERPARVGEAEEVIRAKTKTNITGRSSPLSTNPFRATLALRIEPAPPGSGIEFRHRRRGPARPAVPVPDGRDVRDADGGVRPRGADRGPGRLAGDRLPGHDDRLRLRVAGHQPGRLPAAHPARADDRAGAGRHVGLRAAHGPHARGPVLDRAGRRGRAGQARRPGPRPVLGEWPVHDRRRCCRSPASAASSTSCPASRWGRGSSRRASAATSRSAATRRGAPRSGPSPLDRDAWLASLAKRG